MKRFLVIANVIALGVVAATCGPMVMHATQHTAHTAHVTVHFGQKLAYSNPK